MKITAALAAELAMLTAALDEPGTDIGAQPAPVGRSTARRRGVQLSRSERDCRPQRSLVHAHPPSRTVVTAGDVGTSLRAERCRSLVTARTSPAVAFILYARTPGAFVDLAADLAWLTGTPTHRLRSRSAPHRRRRVAASTAGSGIGDQSGHRRPHRPRLHPAAGPSGTRHPSRPRWNGPTDRRPCHPGPDHSRRRRPVRHPLSARDKII